MNTATATAEEKSMGVRHPYAVRQIKSGYTGVKKFIVVKNPGGSRVSVHAHHTRQSAQSAADQLNIGEMVKDHAEDPRPYAVRRAEAEAAYYAEQKES